MKSPLKFLPVVGAVLLLPWGCGVFEEKQLAHDARQKKSAGERLAAYVLRHHESTGELPDDQRDVVPEEDREEVFASFSKAGDEL